jgi:hypothetical protein
MVLRNVLAEAVSEAWRTPRQLSVSRYRGIRLGLAPVSPNLLDTASLVGPEIPNRGKLMPNRSAVANGADPVQQKAAADASAVQDAVNLVAVVGCFHRHLLALHRRGVCGDDLVNHPVSLAFVSKLNSLCRMSLDREMAALSAIDRLERGEVVEYEVVPL